MLRSMLAALAVMAVVGGAARAADVPEQERESTLEQASHSPLLSTMASQILVKVGG